MGDDSTKKEVWLHGLHAVWDNAVGRAVKVHPELAEKAFVKGEDGFWQLRPGVLLAYYLGDEAMLVGLLVEVRHHLVGLSGIQGISKVGGGRPSQLIWKAAPEAAQLVLGLDEQQRQVVKDLLY